MTERQKLFRRVFQSMIEGRSLQAQRYITEYLKERQGPDARSRGGFTER